MRIRILSAFVLAAALASAGDSQACCWGWGGYSSYGYGGGYRSGWGYGGGYPVAYYPQSNVMYPVQTVLVDPPADASTITTTATENGNTVIRAGYTPATVQTVPAAQTYYYYYPNSGYYVYPSNYYYTPGYSGYYYPSYYSPGWGGGFSIRFR